MLRLFVLLAALVLALPGSPAAAAPSPPRTMVVYVGGLGSSTSSAAANFSPLVRALLPRAKFGMFLYGGTSATYTPERTCQPIDDSTAELAAYVRDLRDRGDADRVVLVGHSNGGVVALGVAAAAPDLVPFIRRVVTVDSPLGGIKYGDGLLYGARFGACEAADELYRRHAAATWAPYLVQLATWELEQGVDVAAIVNPADLVVSVEAQQLAGVAANYTIEATGPDWSHAAVLHAPAALAQLAAIVAAP